MASNLKFQLLPFSDLPLGARFRYPGAERIYTLLDRQLERGQKFLSGTIATWEPNMLSHGKWSGQGIFSHIAGDHHCPEMVEAVDES